MQPAAAHGVLRPQLCPQRGRLQGERARSSLASPRTTGADWLTPEVPTAQVLVEYVWSAGAALKSKTRVLDSCTCLEDVPVISETVGDEPVVLRPRKLFADPFRPADRGFIVLCDAFAAPQASMQGVGLWLHSTQPSVQCKGPRAAQPSRQPSAPLPAGMDVGRHQPSMARQGLEFGAVHRPAAS